MRLSHPIHNTTDLTTHNPGNPMSRLSYILTIIAVLLPGLTYSRELPENCHAVDSLRAELRDARTASDSTDRKSVV